MKITAKTTKAQLLSAIGDNIKALKNGALKDQIGYTSKAYAKDPKSVKRSDLVSLVKQLMTALGDKFIEPVLAEEFKPVAETSLKKGSGKSKNNSEKEEEPEKSEEKAVKSAKKSPKKKETGVTALEEKTVQLAESFPETIEVEGATYELAKNIKSMTDLHKAFENDEELIFAFYWSKRHLRQFPYFNNWFGTPKEFPQDLDLSSCIYVSDEGRVAYAVSMYEEAVYMMRAEDIPEFEGVRFSNGIEYQIYRKS